MSLRRPLQRSLMFAARPFQHPGYNFNSNLTFSSPFPYPSRSLRSHPHGRASGDLDPEEIPGYGDGEDIPFEKESLPRTLTNAGPSQTVALEVNDPWAFLQGTPPKSAYHNIPTFRAMPQTGPFRTKFPAQLADQRQEGMSSTLTEREREIFTQIFETILSDRPNLAPRSMPVAPFPGNSLNALFESAVGPQQIGSEISFGPKDTIDKASAAASLAMASSIEEYPAALRLAAAKAAGLMRPHKAIQENLIESVSMVGMMEGLKSCNTDLELGQWIDGQVFSLVENGHLETSLKYPPGSYAYLLAEGMKVLRTTFNDFAGCLSIFERIKKLGAESYVLGCSVDVYNQAIAAKWEAYRDLYKIKDLVDEMDINGMQGDSKTVQLLHDIMDDVSAMDHGLQNSAARAMFAVGNTEILEHLNRKAEVWNIPEKDSTIEESLNMSG